MKVTYFLGQFPATSETFIINQIVGLMDLGIDVDILAIRPSNQVVNHAALAKYNLLSRTRYLLPEKEGDSTRVKFSKRVWFLLKNIHTKGVVESFNFKKFGTLTKSLLIPALSVSIKEVIRADIIVAHFGVVGVVANALRTLNKIEGKLLTVIHGADISKSSILRVHKDSYEKLFQDCEMMLPISQKWEKKLLELGCSPQKVKLNRMGVDLQLFSPKPFDKPISEPVILISVARFIEKKGLSYAIEAVSQLLSDGFLVEYWIIGEGQLKESLEEKIKQSNHAGKIKLLGLLPQEDIKKRLFEADIFLLPSVIASDGDMEGIPVVLMEAMASGLVTVSTFHSGIPELIEHEVSGFLASERSSIELTKSLKNIIQGNVNITQIRKNAREKVEKEFNQRILYQELAAIIQTCNDS
ncbi:glycosyltransferase [Paraglaciecola aquimarina]|uniref:Glycosyltransferase n=1 Tax=Paraglaciecola algarum TaxID=3050085 RepID=A0ABS9D667_9ALTE|nr:glycosyltransferase [Paraglaciecola sp. G1-23]MCF2948433.1 glycosyltransferase [Paraglaciecola sp. G1-23]